MARAGALCAVEPIRIGIRRGRQGREPAQRSVPGTACRPGARARFPLLPVDELIVALLNRARLADYGFASALPQELVHGLEECPALCQATSR